MLSENSSFRLTVEGIVYSNFYFNSPIKDCLYYRVTVIKVYFNIKKRKDHREIRFQHPEISARN